MPRATRARESRPNAHMMEQSGDATKNAPEWIDTVTWIKISRRNLVQQWREQKEVFAADQHDFYIATAGDGFVQICCCVKASEAAAENDDSCL